MEIDFERVWLMKEYGYAIIRIDYFNDIKISLRECITIKRIVWSEETAEQEVERLNALNGHKGCEYFWQCTRVDVRIT